MDLLVPLIVMAVVFLVMYFRANKHDLDRIYVQNDSQIINIPTILSTGEFEQRLKLNVPTLSSQGYKLRSYETGVFIFSEGPSPFVIPPLLHLIRLEGDNIIIKTLNTASYNNTYRPLYKQRFKESVLQALHPTSFQSSKVLS